MDFKVDKSNDDVVLMIRIESKLKRKRERDDTIRILSSLFER